MTFIRNISELATFPVEQIGSSISSLEHCMRNPCKPQFLYAKNHVKKTREVPQPTDRSLPSPRSKRNPWIRSNPMFAQKNSCRFWVSWQKSSWSFFYMVFSVYNAQFQRDIRKPRQVGDRTPNFLIVSFAHRSSEWPQTFLYCRSIAFQMWWNGYLMIKTIIIRDKITTMTPGIDQMAGILISENAY